jgi:hypothetical protein
MVSNEINCINPTLEGVECTAVRQDTQASPSSPKPMPTALRHAFAVLLFVCTVPCYADARSQLSITHIQTGFVSATGAVTSLLDQDTSILIESDGGVAQDFSQVFSSGRALEADESFFVNVSLAMTVWDDGQPAAFTPGYVFPGDEFLPVSGAHDVAMAWIGLGHGVGSEPGIVRWGDLMQLRTNSDSSAELYTQFSFAEGVVFAVGQATGLPQTITLYAAVFAQGGVTAVPEPATLAMMLGGLGLLAVGRRKLLERR